MAHSDNPQSLVRDLSTGRLSRRQFVQRAAYVVLRFAGALGTDVAAGLMKPDGAVAGLIGGEALANFRLRFDFPAGRLRSTSESSGDDRPAVLA